MTLHRNRRRALFAGHLGVVVLVASCACLVASIRKRDAMRRHGIHNRPTDPESACGPVSVSVAARLLGRSVSIDEINKRIILPPSGATSMLDLKRVLEELGFVVESVQYSPSAGLPRLGVPAIVHLMRDHFVAVLAVNDSTCILIDPPRKVEVIDTARLEREWDGTVLLVSTRDEPELVP